MSSGMDSRIAELRKKVFRSGVPTATIFPKRLPATAEGLEEFLFVVACTVVDEGWVPVEEVAQILYSEEECGEEAGRFAVLYSSLRSLVEAVKNRIEGGRS